MRIKKEENEHVNEHGNEYENEHENEYEHKNEHECSICEISFSLATTLEKHVKVLHLEIEKNESIQKFIPEPNTDLKLERNQQNGHLETKSNSMQESKSAILLKHNLQKNELTQKNDLPSDHGFGTSKQKPNNPESEGSKSYVRKQLYSKPFKCEKCGLRFKHENHLEIHDQIHSNSNFESYACKFCAKTFKKIEEVVVHERVHSGEKPLSCKFCDKTFTQLSNKKRHELLHTGEKPHSCQFCDKQFRVQSNMKVHEKKCETHPERKLINEIPESNKIEHQQKLKNNELVHKNDLPNSCNAIKKNFTDSKFGTSKMPNLSEDLFSCKLCSGTFRYESHLKKHKGVHKGGKKGENNKKFTHKTILKLAEAKENLKNNKLILENDLPNSSEKMSCQFCSGTFRYGSHLRKHERIHTGYLMTKCLFFKPTTRYHYGNYPMWMLKDGSDV